MNEETTWAVVKLTEHEMRVAALIGAERQLQSASSPGTKHGTPTLDPWMMHLNAVASEIAVAKALGRYWPPSVGTFRSAADIPAGQHGPAIEVRWISRADYDLKIRNDDSLESMYVLTSGNAPNIILHGYMQGSECKKAEFWTDLNNGRPGLWCVPKRKLYGPQGRRPEHFRLLGDEGMGLQP